jgi:hypothetical protein
MPVFYRPGALTESRCRVTVPWGINPGFPGLSPCKRWVAYALRTRAPLSSRPKPGIPYDLHVLGLPLAFILSQDQTLHCKVSAGREFMHGRLFLFGSLFPKGGPKPPQMDVFRLYTTSMNLYHAPGFPGYGADNVSIRCFFLPRDRFPDAFSRLGLQR